MSAACGAGGGGRRGALALAFLCPALVLLGVWIVYPAIYTIVRSFLDRAGTGFVGFGNYQRLLASDILRVALRNSALWVLVVPAATTALGLLFAVLTERIGWALVFKAAVFMPMAISAFAAGVTWRVLYVQDPSRGALNAGIAALGSLFDAEAPLSNAQPSSAALRGDLYRGLTLAQPVRPGETAALGLTAIAAAEIPGGAEQALPPEPLPGGIRGVVWRDFRPGGGVAGVIETGESGLPGLLIELRSEQGEVLRKTASRSDGGFAFEDVAPGAYQVAVGPASFARPFGGIAWLGPGLITPSILIAYLWVWTGFAMVVIAAGLAAIPRDVLEAARTDGASEWQVLRHVTIPLLAPILGVVFVTLLLNVLKVFDIVLAIAPGSVQDDASVLALAMWRTAFGGTNDFGLGSAIAVLLFVLVLPVLILGVRRLSPERG